MAAEPVPAPDAPPSPGDSDLAPVNPPRKKRRLWRWVFGLLLLLVVLAAGAAGILAYGTGYIYQTLPPAREQAVDQIPDAAEEPQAFLTDQQQQQQKYLTVLDKANPHENYIVIDSTQNWIFVRNGEDVLLDARCSTGSQHILRTPKKDYIFDTPRGVFRVNQRLTSPVWNRPVWDFYERGMIPPAEKSAWVEEGTLGEYALYLEDGFMIHGTLYERLIGRSVTHGCIRVGKEPLRKIWELTKIGTPVFIF